MIITFKGNTDKHFKDAYYVRKTVFMDEQGFSYDLDEMDKIATHVVYYLNDKPVGAGRIFEKEDVYHIGRICVLSPYRHHHYASLVMDALEETGFKETDVIQLSAQCQARGFYEKRGYVAYGKEYLDEFCPHIDMKKSR